jgi:hypothetical protein
MSEREKMLEFSTSVEQKVNGGHDTVSLHCTRQMSQYHYYRHYFVMYMYPWWIMRENLACFDLLS